MLEDSCGQFYFETQHTNIMLQFCAVFLILVSASYGVEHNLPPGVELVDPKSLGLDSQFDLDKLLGNVKLLPNSGKIDPKTGTKTQILTVGFDDENINLDDFELPGNMNGGNNSELVSSAFESFRDYIKNKPSGSSPQIQSSQPTQIEANQPEVKRKNVVMRRRKIVKTTPQPVETTQQGPKVVELDSSQIEKLLATGKLKSKKVGDSQVIEITQEQLNDLYAMENGGEFKSLLGGASPVDYSSSTLSPQKITQTTQQITTVPQPTSQLNSVTVPTREVPVTSTKPISTTAIPTISTSTQPPIIYQFNTKDFENNQNYVQRPQLIQQNYQPQYIQQQQQQQQNYEPKYVQQNNYQKFPINQNQPQQHKVLKTPTYEFISVPTSSFSTTSLNQNQNAQQIVTNQPNYFNIPQSNIINPLNNFRQDPLPHNRRPTNNNNKVVFPSSNSNENGNRFHRDLGLNTYFQGDGLNYKISMANQQDQLWGV